MRTVFFILTTLVGPALAGPGWVTTDDPLPPVADFAWLFERPDPNGASTCVADREGQVACLQEGLWRVEAADRLFAAPDDERPVLFAILDGEVVRLEPRADEGLLRIVGPAGEDEREMPQHARAVVGDFDGDGLPDLVAIAPDGDGALYRGREGLAFEELPIDVEPLTLDAGDWDADGTSELLVRDAEGRLAVYRLDEGRWDLLDERHEVGDEHRLVAADLDGDRRSELVSLADGPVTQAALWAHKDEGPGQAVPLWDAETGRAQGPTRLARIDGHPALATLVADGAGRLSVRWSFLNRADGAGDFFWFGRLLLSGDRDAMCAAIYDGQNNNLATHAGVDTLLVGQTAVVSWCFSCPFPRGCQFTFTVDAPRFLAIAPRIFLFGQGVWAGDLSYTGRAAGIATVILQTGGSTHTVQVVEPSPEPGGGGGGGDGPDAPEPEPEQSPRPSGRFVAGGEPRPTNNLDGLELVTEWTVAPGTRGADLDLTIGDPALRLVRPIPSWIPEGTTEVRFELAGAGPGVRQVAQVPIRLRATNVDQGEHRDLQGTVRVDVVPTLHANGSSARQQTMDFGTVIRGDYVEHDLWLSHEDGSLPFDVGLVDLSGGIFGGSAWSLDGSGPDGCGNGLAVSMPPGRRCRITIRFQPINLVDIRAHAPGLRIEPTGAANGQIDVVLSGIGAPAPILDILGAPHDTLDFGLQPYRAGIARSITVRNDGDPDSVLEGTIRKQGSGAFRITAGAGAFSIPAGQSRTVEVTFDPSGATTYSGALIIESNDVVYPEKRIALAGEHARARVWYRVFIPYPEVENPFPFPDCSEGDDRWFSPGSGTHRQAQFVEIDLADGSVMDGGQPAGNLIGVTHTRHCGGIIGPAGRIAHASASTGCLQQSVEIRGDWAHIRFQSACAHPLIPGSFDIDVDLHAWINRHTKVIHFGGAHDGFPAYEAYARINGGATRMLYSDAPASPAEIWNLGAPMDVQIPIPPIPAHTLIDNYDGGVSLPGGL